MALPITKAGATITGARPSNPVLLGETVRSVAEGAAELSGGNYLTWEMAADASTGVNSTGAVVVDFQELVSREPLSRHRALRNICHKGMELHVSYRLDQRDFGGAGQETKIFPPDLLTRTIEAIKVVLSFDSSCVDITWLDGGWCLLRLAIGDVAVPVLEEVPAVLQHFWTGGRLSLYLGNGFYGLEQTDEKSFSWMGAHGSVFVRSSEEQLVKVELWVEPFISRPQTLTFGGNAYQFVGKTKVTAYGCVIPGHNPFNLFVDGVVESPLERGLSTDSRKIALKILGGCVSAL